MCLATRCKNPEGVENEECNTQQCGEGEQLHWHYRDLVIVLIFVCDNEVSQYIFSGCQITLHFKGNYSQCGIAGDVRQILTGRQVARVVRGYNAARGAWPWQVMIVNKAGNIREVRIKDWIRLDIMSMFRSRSPVWVMGSSCMINTTYCILYVFNVAQHPRHDECD